jgi:hypothetical protein
MLTIGREIPAPELPSKRMILNVIADGTLSPENLVGRLVGGRQRPALFVDLQGQAAGNQGAEIRALVRT